MKALIVLLLSLISCNLFSQEVIEKEVKSEVNEVTVFLNNAQIVRKKAIELTKGISIIKYVNLSPFIDAKSIQVKADGDVTVLSVNHQQNFLDRIEKSTELTEIEKQLETLEDKITVESTYLSIIKDEIAFLQDNRNIGGKNEQVSITNLQQVTEFYSNKLTSLKMKEIERNKTLITLNQKKSEFQNQIKNLTSNKDNSTGEILIKVDAKQSKTYSFEISYLVRNAGWFPSYDIRVKDISEPVQLIYKANVRQDTKVDWSNAKISFSSANPSISGVMKELKTYHLNYNSLPPTYTLTNNTVTGKVFDQDGPLPGTTVIVEGTTIGVITDIEGNYSITIPNNSSYLTYSFIGYNTKTLPITESVINVTLEEDNQKLEQVVVTAYGIGRTNKSLGYSSTDQSDIKIRGTSSLALPIAQNQNQTTIDFEISTPYTIKSDNKNYMIDMQYYNLSAFYQYHSIPKISKDAFLIANIIDWEKYNLMEGEANVFFEDTYVGKTIIDVRYASDTLEISLGRDKSVSVNREKITDFISKQFIGSKKEETRAWKTIVKNNKNQTISMIILDQVPISNLEEIEVNVQDVSGAKLNQETGEIKWIFELKPNDKKELDLKYSVKYPKNRNLVLE